MISNSSRWTLSSHTSFFGWVVDTEGDGEGFFGGFSRLGEGRGLVSFGVGVVGFCSGGSMSEEAEFGHDRDDDSLPENTVLFKEIKDYDSQCRTQNSILED